MEPEKQQIPSTSKSVSKLSKTSRESSVSTEKNCPKDQKGSGKFPIKVKKDKEKITKKGSSKRMYVEVDLRLHPSVKRLHDRTKHVEKKLSLLIQESDKIKPPRNKRLEDNMSEEDILREIERLQKLMKKIKLKKKSSNPESKANNPSQSDDVDTKVESDGKSDNKPKKRRYRTKKKKNGNEETELQTLYVSHINQIINKNGKDQDPTIPCYKHGDDLEEFATKCVDAGLGRIVEAELRVNAKNNHQAFITLNEGQDAMILSMATRKYAMDRDVVRAFVRNPHRETRESVCELDESMSNVEDPNVTIDCPEDALVNDVEILKKSEESALALRDRAFVLRVVKESGNRRFVGSIAFLNPAVHDDGEYFKFKSRDTKAPIMCIPVNSCEELLATKDILGFLFVAEVVKIEENGRCLGKLVEPVGVAGNLEAEIKAILMHNRLSDVQPFEQRFEDMWSGRLTIENSEVGKREDLREECIFTIDPLTARDLDDAVSCKKLENGDFEIGVHISDVTHFLEESCELDELVKMRATSIYLVNEVIHMLPQSLCMKCSLLPNQDKFTFSVFWIMDKDANVKSTRFTRSVMRSCCQLAYEHAQKIIDNPNETYTDNDFPTIGNGYAAADVVQRVKTLNSLAEIMRAKRFENGSLSIDKPQFYFNLDPKTGEPTSYEITSRLTANFLIEEFMLLANRSVAEFIHKSFPDIAFLRSHQPPKPSALKNLKNKLNAVGIELDMSSSKTIYDGLQKICGASSSKEVVSVAMNYLLTKPMMRAKYFCSENAETETDLYHYALAIPIYTHFTSPIRRYPDILVHRLLSAAMKYTATPKRTPEELHELARICNDQKQNAKSAGEESCDLYFKRYINQKKSVNFRAVVVDIYRHSMEVIVLETGHLILVPFKIQKVNVDATKAPNVVCIAEKNSAKPPLELKMFSEVHIKLMLWEKRLTGFFVTPDKAQRKKNDIESIELKLNSVPNAAPGSRLKKQRREQKSATKSTKGSTDD